MEKNQYKLCLEVLGRMHKNGILKNVILIGSWCIPFYEGYFKETTYVKSIFTRDIDLLVPAPSKFRSKVGLAELLKDLGFLEEFKGSEGYLQLMHPELIIEFLVPEKGRGSDKPCPLKGLGMNAQPLRLLNILTENTISVKIKNIPLRLPHPANFALHKLVIAQRRKNKDKGNKDREAAIRILEALINKGDNMILKKVFRSLFKKQQFIVLKELKNLGQEELINILDVAK